MLLIRGGEMEHQINTPKVQLKTTKIHRLRLNNHRTQNFGDLSKTMANFKEALNKKITFKLENRHVILGGETLHAKRCCRVSKFIARVSRMAMSMVCRDVKVTLQAY